MQRVRCPCHAFRTCPEHAAVQLAQDLSNVHESPPRWLYTRIAPIPGRLFSSGCLSRFVAVLQADTVWKAAVSSLDGHDDLWFCGTKARWRNSRMANRSSHVSLASGVLDTSSKFAPAS